jgi:hypothetical protein
VAKGKEFLGKTASLAQGRSAGSPWWDGRQVAIRPDVPGPAFDPDDLVLVRSDEERVEVQSRIERSVDEAKEKSSEDLWPSWLWDADGSTPADASDSAVGGRKSPEQPAT